MNQNIREIKKEPETGPGLSLQHCAVICLSALMSGEEMKGRDWSRTPWEHPCPGLTFRIHAQPTRPHSPCELGPIRTPRLSQLRSPRPS